MEIAFYKIIDVILTVFNFYIMWAMRRIQIDKRVIEQYKDANKVQDELITTMQKEIHILKTQAHACIIRDHHLKDRIDERNR